MSFRVETGLLNPQTDQYAGSGRVAVGIDEVAREARRMEQLGFDGICTPEAGHDPFLPLMVAAEHTESVRLGTNVAIAFPRSPMAVAQAAWDLQQYSHGRFSLGLGTQVKGHNELRYASPWTAPPGPRLREYLLCMRAMFESFASGETVKFEGEHYRFSLLPPFFNPGPTDYGRPKVQIAAVNPYMCRLGGELCDGLRLHPIGTFAYTKAVVLPAIAKGAATAGRKPGDIEVVGAPFLAVGSDDEAVAKAKAEARQHIAFYASTRSYHRVLEFHGWQDVGTELHRMSREGKWREMPGLISDDMLEEWALIATFDGFAAKAKERCEGVFDTVLLDLPPQLRCDDERIAAIVAALRTHDEE
jgi:probable F420-dependent oxidoreductase